MANALGGLFPEGKNARFFQKEASALQAKVSSLEEALAVSADMLLTYKDYYGTSIAQVKHLQECELLYDTSDNAPFRCHTSDPGFHSRCGDYPEE